MSEKLKIDFSYVSELCASFRTRKMNILGHFCCSQFSKYFLYETLIPQKKNIAKKNYTIKYKIEIKLIEAF